MPGRLRARGSQNRQPASPPVLQAAPKPTPDGSRRSANTFHYSLERKAGCGRSPHADGGQEAGASMTVCSQAEPGNKGQGMQGNGEPPAVRPRAGAGMPGRLRARGSLNRQTARAAPPDRSVVAAEQHESELFAPPKIFRRCTRPARPSKVGGMQRPGVQPHTFDAAALERFAVLACFLPRHDVCTLPLCCDCSNRALQGACLSLE
ncbi:hypothetical protein Enr13x_12820 [Stieleria neptunia]|uniref:Uncharacterized protein n=1 Tax=Stieleria neptunia TaxID=2527979 RepID=A0A518HKT6_9BACT|nr:hypothetical protein Enr13x_12820 [Stieleria neptunia]